MHLLAATPGSVSDGSEAIDLGQTPGDIVVLSAADTDLACLAAARRDLASDLGHDIGDDFPSLRLANLLHLGHNLSVDLYVEQVIEGAKLVVVRLLGGRGYWSYGLEQVAGVCREKGIKLAVVPGDDQPDPELSDFCTLASDACHRLWQYGVHGGIPNARECLKFAATLLGHDLDWREPVALMRAGVYWPGLDQPDVAALQPHWKSDAPVVAIVFYRALVQAANLKPVDAMIHALTARGINALPLFTQSLKDPVAAGILTQALDEAPPAVILNATGFAVSAPGAVRTQTPFDAADCPVLQMVFSGGNRDQWADGVTGLSARDIAMNVALPEVDGRILSRAVSFKGLARRDDLTEFDIVEYAPVADRIAFVADLAASWARLRETPTADRRVALVLANYPNRDGRLGNGVGLDTPAGTMNVLSALKQDGWSVDDLPEDGADLIARLQSGPTNAATDGREIRETLAMNDYQAFFAGLPQVLQDAVIERWGAAEHDPFYLPGEVDCGRFAIPGYRCGNVAVCLQPARGYNIDPTATYHDPALVPPHGYLAFYAWVRRDFDAHAVIHMGKHGNLEWLPGKSIAMSETCFPEAALGPMPHLYPFIVNDPGEGTQAKRRAQAVIIDHLTPPLTRAESYGPLRDLEQLVDEYFEAAGVDPRRLDVLRRDILSLAAATGLDHDCGIDAADGEADQLAKLDTYLCELKELQIRDGLHIFGEAPRGRLLTDTLVALTRVPRTNLGAAKNDGDQSLIRAIADDLGLGFDPLDCEMSAPWSGPTPAVLSGEDTWRTAGDAVERIECLAARLVAGEQVADTGWARTRAVMAEIDARIRPSVEASGPAETAGLIRGLSGRFVAPGPSGAPTRGRPDVLPTGRNFYSVDTRTVPTPAAWQLGWKSATLLIERHAQDHGDWPRRLALTAWGTSNMRTGGDDIAQALALMGVKPTWDSASRRVTGFEVMPQSVLGRPRVDVTLRISGFFRDAFPGLIDLFDSAVRAVADMDEEDSVNPIRAARRAECDALVRSGLDAAEADKRAGFRVFGSKPGAYGAGLQAMIDEKLWESEADLARAYVAWGGYAYGAGAQGEARHGLFEQRLTAVEAVVQNQDNREHDLLDSDDYYQFEGGMTAAVRELSGKQPATYHMDHSRPETPKARTLDEEIARVVRARVVNPKWIEGVMRHGYKGAFEMAATVDYLFAFAATAHCVRDHHFDAVFDAYLNDDRVREFMEEHNPQALKEMTNRLLEAQDRGLWKPRLNSTRGVLESLSAA